MEEDVECARRNTQSAECAKTGSSRLNVLHTTPIYNNPVLESSKNPPTTFISQHGALTSSRTNHEAHGTSCCGCLLPALLMVLLLMCATLQSVLIFLQVSGRTEPSSSSKSSAINGSSGCSLRCPDLWIFINDKCYFLSEDRKSNADSDKYCIERDSRLAVVKEETIRRLVNITGKEFWVGISKYNKHGEVWLEKWSGCSLENLTDGIGNCAKLGSRLTMENCYTELHWICEKDNV